VFRTREAFLCYLPRDREIREKLVEAAKNRGLAAGMQPALEAFDCSESEFKEIIAVSLMSDDIDIVGWAAIAAQEHPDDEHMPKLIAIATDPNRPRPDRPSYPIQRHRAIIAIAHNRTDEGVQALKALLDDPDESIRGTASDAIRHAYRRHRIYPEPADREYTAQLVPIAMDCNDPRQTSMIVEIARTRTEEGVKAIKTLLEDPNKNVPLAEADQGVKAIRDLLRNPNKGVRDMTAQTIRFIYKSYPGRPLRNDDFGDTFRENFEEQKKKFLERLRRESVQ
jgi:HEAT repeat protein